MRLFYASFLSSENMQAYESLVAGVVADVPNGLRSIPERTHHLTLAFVGEVADGDVGNRGGGQRPGPAELACWRHDEHQLVASEVSSCRRHHQGLVSQQLHVMRRGRGEDVRRRPGFDLGAELT